MLDPGQVHGAAGAMCIIQDAQAGEEGSERKCQAHQ